MPEETFETLQPTEPKPTNWPKMILVTVLSLGLLAAAAYAGYWYGTQQAQPVPAPPSAGQPTPKPTPKPTPSPTPTPQPISPAPTNSNQQSKTYDGKFISFRYQASWYVWSYGRGVSLDYFQMNSISQADELNPNRVIIDFDIQIPGYTEGQTLEEQKKRVEGFQQESPDFKYVISERKIDGLDALVYERTIANSPSSPGYEKTVWVRKNNVKYIITMAAFGETQQAMDSLVNQYKQDFENVLNTVKLKYVDPAEVERLGNHPD